MELDAYRFAKMSTAQTLVKADITVGTTDCVELIDAAQQQMYEDEVPMEGRILFVSPTMYSGIKAKITRYLANENDVNRQIEMFDNMPVIVVPQNRFNTAITLNDGSESFGYTPTAGGYKINFMIVHPSAVKNVVKAAIPKVFSPDEFQSGDCWAFQYRLYHDCFLWENKVKGIYTHTKSTANS